MNTTSEDSKLPVALFVDDDPDFLEGVSFVAQSNKLCDITTLTDSSQTLDELETGKYSVLYLDWIMPKLSGADLLPIVIRKFPTLPVIVMTGVHDVDTAVLCMKQGAFDYLTKPLESSRLISSLKSALKIVELSNENKRLQDYLLGEPIVQPDIFSEILTVSEKMKAIFKLIEAISSSRYPVMITGESGVGKELIARAVHKASGLKGDFVPLNVAGLDATLFEDTLFGHKKGAFTGASESREGLITKAQSGTIFLDEIGDLTLDSQIKLLRLLQENEYYRLGSDILHKNSARIIVASNRNFQRMIEDGNFRDDLYHRLRCHRLHIPPLRERKEDILLLAEHYIALSAKQVGKAPPGISAELQFILTEYEFPGNIRELMYMVANAVITNKTGILTHADFQEIALQNRSILHESAKQYSNGQFSLHVVFPSFPTMDQVEKVMIREAIKATGGKQSASADLLGLCRQTVKKKLAELEG